jgi:TolB-like protein/DNA-binding winged helix-turn-helix (wHTH) protein/tetratricopeptide (TPR) repeat protein
LTTFLLFHYSAFASKNLELRREKGFTNLRLHKREPYLKRGAESGRLAEIKREFGGNVLGQMEKGPDKNFVFAEFNLRTELQTLRREGAEIHLAKRPFDVLLFLIQNRDRVVGREELLNRFWDGREVYDDALRKCVGAIRTALDDLGKPPRFIQTRRGSGFRFIGSVSEAPALAGTLNPSQSPVTNYQLENQEPLTKNNGERREKQISQFALKNRKLLLAVVAVVLISLTALGFFAHRGEVRSVEPKTLTDVVSARRSIAILPLKNLTGDAANDYLSDGITESLINEISRIESLKVTSRSSAFQFKNKEAPAQEIGEKLGVETILEGGLRESGEQFRVEVRLVNTKDGSVRWASDSEQKKLADIFAIQDGITCQIVTELKVKLCGELAPASRSTQNVKAYQLYLQGLYHRNQLTEENLQKAVDFFEAALRVEPNYALAHDGLAAIYMVMEFNSLVPPGTAAPKAELQAQKALELDSSLAGPYIVLGAVRTMQNYDLKTRESYYRQALLKNPNHPTAHLWLANNFTVQGKFEEAEREIFRVQELDPLSLGVRLHLSELYYYWRKPDKAIEQAELMLAANPENKGAYSFLAKAYAQKGEFDKAFAALGKNPTDDVNRVYILALVGRGDEARNIIEAFAKSDAGSRNPYCVGTMYAAIGEHEKAFAWLEKSYAMRQADLVSIKIDPPLDNLRGDEHFRNLLQRVHLTE